MLAFRFLLAFASFATVASGPLGRPLVWSPVASITGRVGPSLEYGGVAVRDRGELCFSDDEANISLMRFGFAIDV